MTHKPPQGIYARVRELRSKLGDLLADEDLTDEKLREASEGLLPNIYDALAAPDPRKDLALEEHAVSWEVVPDSSKMACDGIRVERRDGFEGRRWAIVQRGYVLNKLGDWEYEPQPSSRNEEWLKTVRWDSFAGALKAAEMRGAKR